MRVLIVCTIILSGLSTQSIAGKTGNDLSTEDIELSTARIQHAFAARPHRDSVIENGIIVGEVSSKNEEFYITYRPSLGLEILNCTDKNRFPLIDAGLDLTGHGHKGLTQLFSTEDINKTVVTPFLHYKSETQLPTEQMTILVDGMSAGAHRAVETALYLKQHPDIKNHNLVVLRYGDAKTFDDIAVDSIHKLLGRENIISFHALGDKIVEFMDMPDVEAHLGRRVEFSATESEDYVTRVRTRSYTCMASNLRPLLISVCENPTMKASAQMLLSFMGITSEAVEFLTPELWELHQPITYAKLVPSAFITSLDKKLGEMEKGGGY